MANSGYSCDIIQETQYAVMQPRAEVWEDKQRGVEFTGHNQAQPAIERHVAMLHQNQTDRWLPCQNLTAKNRKICCRRKGTGVPPPNWRIQTTPEPIPPLPGTPPLSSMPPTAPGNNAGAQCSQIVTVLAGYAYSHTLLPCAEQFTLDWNAQDSQHDTDFDPDMLTMKEHPLVSTLSAVW